jgi:uncharacterized repeat protein (TIGR01451 family)
LLQLSIGALALGLVVLPADAIIDINLQMQLGNPTGAIADTNNHSHYLIQRAVEAIDYNDSQGQPNWASWDLTSADVGSSGRSDAWAVDTNLPPNFNQIPINGYGSLGGQSYDRGHMCPSADRTDTVAHNDQVFIMSNIIPQASAQNEDVWANFEDYCRTLVSAQELLIMCGPYNFGQGRLDSGLVGVASNTWKIVVGVPLGSGTALSRITNANPNAIRVIALEIPNTDAAGGSAWTAYVTSAKKVQNDTGYNFFGALPNNVAWVLRSKVDGQTPAAPGAISFSPPSGMTGAAVTVTGANLDTITNLAFNGTTASYTITSPTQIVATVPASAASGAITVNGLGGNVASASSFSVNTAANPDLTLALIHSGNFTQGDTRDSYTVIVTNIGTAPSTGTVTVVDTLPAGLTTVAASGSGWTTDVGPPVTCTRSDPIGAGAAYPPITITVSVDAGAPASVTNSANVSGGDDVNLANNTALDATTIIAAAAPSATTGAASSVSTTSATLNGTVNPNGQQTTVQFEYGSDTGYGSIAPISGVFTGTTAQAVSANLTGLVPGASYHFRLTATNVLGASNGADQVFIAATTAVVDLAITATHTGNFTQGDAAATYTILVTNLGNSASSGTVSVVDALPAGLTATAISGNGWTTNLTTLTCTRADELAAGGGYPPITITVNVATNAPASVTNVATVSGGNDASPANNIASDPTTINLSSVNSGIVTLVGWDTSTLSGGANNFGPSPFLPTTNAANLTVVAGLTRGAGIGTTGSAAGRGWGGNTFTNASAAAAIASNRFATFTTTASSGYKVSYTAISRFDYRHSGTGPPNGLLQYQIGSGPFTDVANLAYTVATSSGGSLSPIDLSGIAALQNVGAGTNVTFRVVNWGGTSSAGTWYIFDVNTNSAPDLEVQGRLVPPPLTPIQAWRLQWFGSTTNGGVGADTAVASSDGMANLLKYALGLNPLVPTNSPVVGDITTGYLRLTTPRNPNATDVTFRVEVTGDLAAGTWTTDGTTVDQDTPSLLQVHDNVPVDASSGRFIRLHVSEP